MGNFATSWNLSYEGLPPDLESESLGAGRIRDLKFQLRTRMQVDHSWGGTNNDGYHIQATLLSNALDLPVPSVVSDGTYTIAGVLYAKTVAGNAELCYRDSTGNILQLTNAGSLSGLPIQAIPSGTKMIFRQGAAPAGWTQDTSVNDQMIRFVNGASVGQGGNWVISGLSVGNHTLSPSEIPNLTVNQDPTTIKAAGGSIAIGTGTGAWGSGGVGQTSNTGGQPHNHPINQDGTWRPAYADVILASRN